MLVKVGLVDRIKSASGVKFSGIMDKVEPNPDVRNVNDGIQAVKKANARAVLAVGGGSVIDYAKAVCAAVFENCSAEELLEKNHYRGALPLVAIPATAGTGAEVTPFAVISWNEKNIKKLLNSPIFYPAMAIVDPEVTYTSPPKVTASSGIDVLAHALDSLGNKKSNPVSQALALRAAKIAFDNLAQAVEDGNNLEARNQMSLASLLAGLAFSQTGTSASHACSYSLTARFNAPHGEACAFTLDSWVKINAAACPEMNLYAREIGFENADKMSEALSVLKKNGRRTTLKEIGVTEHDLDYLAGEAFAAKNMLNNVAQIDLKGVRDVFLSKF